MELCQEQQARETRGLLGRTLLLALSAAHRSQILFNAACYGFMQDQLWSDINQDFYNAGVRSKSNKAGASPTKLGSCWCWCDSGDKKDSGCGCSSECCWEVTNRAL